MNFPVGIGYITLPSDLDVNQYKALCMRTSTVSIRLNDGAIYQRVPVSLNILDYLYFPERQEDLGSGLIFVNDPVTKGLLIIGVVPDPEQITNYKEHDFRLQRKLGSSVVEVSGNSKSKTINLSVLSDENDKGEITINVGNKNGTGKFTVNVQGESIVISGSNKIVSTKGENILESISPTNTEERTTYKQTSTKHNFDGEFSINNGKSPMSLGDKVAELFSKFITEVSQSTVTVQGVPVPLLNATKIAALQKEIEGLVSKNSFLS